MRRFRAQGPGPLPAAVTAALPAGERPLAWAREGVTGGVVVVGTSAVHLVGPEGADALDRPWHVVDGASWDHEAMSLTLTWVDGTAPTRWWLPTPARVPEVLRERVEATVVILETVELGPSRSARVAVRRDLGSGRLLGQVVLAPEARADDKPLADAALEVLARLEEQAGLR